LVPKMLKENHTGTKKYFYFIGTKNKTVNIYRD